MHSGRAAAEPGERLLMHLLICRGWQYHRVYGELSEAHSGAVENGTIQSGEAALMP